MKKIYSTLLLACITGAIIQSAAAQATPVSGHQTCGFHSHVYDARSFHPGVYTYRFTSGGHTATDNISKF